ncbi:MAG: hypothetical protein R2834_11390 [Rhodothermales bacterium]
MSDRLAGPRWRCLLFLLVLSAAPAMAQDPDAPVLMNGDAEQVATAGFYTLSWAAPAAATAPRYQLEADSTRRFETPAVVYEGPDDATSRSGEPDGERCFRVRYREADRQAWSAWSAAHCVSVRHHPLRRAFGFLAVGAAVFLATLAVVVAGARSDERPS